MKDSNLLSCEHQLVIVWDDRVLELDKRSYEERRDPVSYPP